MSIERETRIKRAIEAYEASGNTKFKVGGRQDEDCISPYWDELVERLECAGLPVPEIETLAFLDLGGGSDSDGFLEPGDQWRPWLARYLVALGAPWVINVDIGPQKPEYNDVYIHLQIKLSDREEFSLVHELKKRGLLREFDIIFSAMLVDEHNPSPALDKKINPRKLEANIKVWAKQLLKEGGYLFLEGGFQGFMLLDNQLVPLNEAGRHLKSRMDS